MSADQAFIYDPKGVLVTVKLYEVLDMTAEEWDKHHNDPDEWSWEESSTIPITPADIKGWIERRGKSVTLA